VEVCGYTKEGAIMETTQLTDEQHELIEQASGGVPSQMVWDEAKRVIDSFNVDDDESILIELSVRPASAESDFSMLNTGEMCFEIATLSYDTDGNQHDAISFIGESGKLYGIVADGVKS
jgi:hypothetical protein